MMSITEMPGGPANAPAEIQSEPQSLRLTYNGCDLLHGVSDVPFKVDSHVSGSHAIEQRIRITFEQETTFQAVVSGSAEAFAAETRGQAQASFSMVRTAHGLSNNLRNNAVYDRNLDWMLEGPEDLRIQASRKEDGTTRFELRLTAHEIEIVFRPRYYQKHKNLPYFQPWTYSIRKDSISGWCSWWPYRRECSQHDVDQVLQIWGEKRLDDFGYRFIQLDDAFQGGNDGERREPAVEGALNYVGGRPETWLEWKTDLFPEGMTGYTKSVAQAGFDPALWVSCCFTDEEIVETHPEWFVQGEDGKPFVGSWVTYVIDSTNSEAAAQLIRPAFRGLRNAGFKYIKIDQLRHMIYDNLNFNQSWMEQQGTSVDEIFRAYLRIAREELGQDCFILSCWGVLPEAVGLADACRIGGDGYGPVTMQQYNSWNGVVWINDPDHCDVSPRKAAMDVGNVLKTRDIVSTQEDTLARPALASMAGCMLMLSDKAEVYHEDANLEGAKRAAPVLFSVPGQLYDFDPKRTDLVKTEERSSIKGGTKVSGIDADQFGEVNPYWLNEFNLPYESWSVFHRINWTAKEHGESNPDGQPLPATTMIFKDLGLDPAKEYLVYEFWRQDFLGVKQGDFLMKELGPMGVQSFAIREKLDRPQLISTSRHLSQGAAEIEQMAWDGNALFGRSQVVAEDPYTLRLFVPKGFRPSATIVNNQAVEMELDGELLQIHFIPTKTASIAWRIDVEQQA